MKQSMREKFERAKARLKELRESSKSVVDENLFGAKTAVRYSQTEKLMLAYRLFRAGQSNMASGVLSQYCYEAVQDLSYETERRFDTWMNRLERGE